MFRIALTIFCGSIIIPGLFSQSLYYQHFGTNEGLPSSQVYDIIQDDWGYIWFSTDHGLSRYDGYSFHNYNSQDGMTDNTVFNFRKYYGIIWCSTYNRSLFTIQGKHPVFIPYPYNDKLINIGRQILVTTSFYLSHNGHLYMSFLNGLGYIHLDEKGNIISNTVRTNKSAVVNYTSIGSNELSGDFFFSEDNMGVKEINGFTTQSYNIYPNELQDYIKGTHLINDETSIFTSKKFIDIVSDQEERIRISCDQEPIGVGDYGNGLFWVGFRSGGLRIYNLKGKLVENYLDGKSVTSCYQDHEGGLWMSTMHDGVYYVKNIHIHSIHFPDQREKWISGITMDGKNGILAGTYNGDVYQINHSSANLIHSSSKNKPAQVEQNLFSGEVFYLADDQLFNMSKGTSVQVGIPALSLLFTGRDSVVVISYVGLHLVTGSKAYTTIFNERIYDIVKFNGRSIAATISGPMLYENNQLTKPYDGAFKNMRVEDMELFNDRLALGTHGYGLIIFDRDSTLIRIGEKEGLQSDFISQLYAENDSILWVCTNAGISQIVLQNDHIHIKGISTNDGLISNEITDIEIIDDTIWVGTREGLCYFSQSYFNAIAEERKKSFLSFHSIRVNDKYQELKSAYQLSYDENRLEIDFQSISFRNGDQLVYRYRLSGLEGNWNYTTQRKAIYSSVPPGKYRFEVQSMSIDGNWDTIPISIQLNILPPYWKTWWFLLSVFMGIILLIYLFFRFRILTYNRDITRELLRQVLKKIRRDERYIVYREQGKDIRILTSSIAYIKSSGNYIEIFTEKGKHIVRSKIGDFLESVPDPLEFLRVHRSYIIRLDKVEQKGTREVVVMGKTIAVGETYIKDLQKIQF